jgi:hypothetical protein
VLNLYTESSCATSPTFFNATTACHKDEFAQYSPDRFGLFKIGYH